MDDQQNSKQTIAPIKEKDIRRIVSGQAITDMASAVKELIDNSLDAGARSIADKIEVDDDGIGVTPQSRKYLATKHATSKISSFDDIYSDENVKPPSLGFRGEALFCLCNISQNLIITTRTAEERVGQKLEFNRDGTLNESKVECIPRKVGTTVSIVKIFHTLPVRRMDFTKRIKSQRARLLKLIQGYAVLCVGVKFSLIDVKKGKSDVILSTSATSQSVDNTVSSVLGARFLMGLSKIHIDLRSIVDVKKEPGTDICTETSPSQHQSLWNVQGLISTSPSEKDSARDLQFFSINDRPVDLPKITRLLGEVWRSSESTTTASKRPACVLKFTIPRSQFDVNVDPSKRVVFLTEGEMISDILREALLQKWSTASSEATFVKNEVEVASKINQKNITSPAPSYDKLDFRQFIHSKISTPKRSRTIQAEMSLKMKSVHELDSITPDHIEQPHCEKREFNTAIVLPQEDYNGQLTSMSSISSQIKESTQEKSEEEKVISAETNLTQKKLPYSHVISSWKDRKRTRESSPTADEDLITKKTKENQIVPTEKACKTVLDVKKNYSEAKVTNEVTWHSFRSTEDVILQSSLAKESLTKTRQSLQHSKAKRSRSSTGKANSPKEQDETDIPCTPPPIDDLIGEDTCITPNILNENSEEHQKKVTLCKQDFVQMSIIGQFNLGFILARCPNNHLWILDQHGCDERYRLEYLTENTVIHQQALLAPLPIELSPMEENCILDNMDLFQLNGFRFECNPEHAIRHRLSLTALPHSGSGQDGKNAVQFGIEDVSSLCNILLGVDGGISGYGNGTDGSSENGNNAVRRYIATANATNKSSKKIRLPKAIAMFASRACWSSVRVGTSLSRKEMKNIVQQMHTVDSPWVCAHGRPTMRHVKDLSDYWMHDEAVDAKYIANPCLAVWTQIDDNSESSDSANDLEVLEEV